MPPELQIGHGIVSRTRKRKKNQVFSKRCKSNLYGERRFVPTASLGSEGPFSQPRATMRPGPLPSPAPTYRQGPALGGLLPCLRRHRRPRGGVSGVGGGASWEGSPPLGAVGGPAALEGHGLQSGGAAWALCSLVVYCFVRSYCGVPPSNSAGDVWWHGSEVTLSLS